MARPSPYKEEYNEQVYKLCLLGAIDTEISDFFNVCERGYLPACAPPELSTTGSMNILRFYSP